MEEREPRPPGWGGPRFHAFREPGMKTVSGASGDATSYECGGLSLFKCSQGGCRREKMKRERENLTGGRYLAR